MNRNLMLFSALTMIAIFTFVLGKYESEQHVNTSTLIREVEQAFQVPSESSLATVVSYGTDSRYYTMIRGWIVNELEGVESQMDGTHISYNSQHLEDKYDFLKEAIRRIDLE